MKIEDLEKRLYQKEPFPDSGKNENIQELKQKTGAAEPQIKIKTSWDLSKKEIKNQFSAIGSKTQKFGKWIFWSFISLTVVAGGLGVFYLYQYLGSKDIYLNLIVPERVLLGEPFEIQFDVKNNSNKIIEETKISMILPEGMADPDDQSKKVINIEIGELPINGEISEKTKLVIIKDSNAIKKLEASVFYYPKTTGPKTRFEKTKSIEIASGESALKIDLKTPEKILSNESFSFEVSYANVSEKFDFDNVEITLNYPQGFVFKSASSTPYSGNNLWRFDKLAPNASGTIVVKGSALGAEQSFFEIRASAKSAGLLLNEKTASINIAPSPLSILIKVNNKTDYVSKANDTLRYSLEYKNNSDTGLNDVVIRAKMTGEMFDFKTLSANAAFNSVENTLVWNASAIPNLRVLNPGSSGAIDFEIKTKTSYPVKKLSDKNFLLKVSAEISSPTVPYYVESDKTIGVAYSETKVAGQPIFQNKAIFYESGWDITNSGPLPLKINQATTFTVHWIISNYATDINTIEIKSTLGQNISWTGQVKSNLDILPVYNERTQEVVWNINRITANKGILSKPAEAVFQVKVVPDITQFNKSVLLINESVLKATDEFTNFQIQISAPLITTDSTGDPLLRPDLGRVSQ